MELVAYVTYEGSTKALVMALLRLYYGAFKALLRQQALLELLALVIWLAHSAC